MSFAEVSENSKVLSPVGHWTKVDRGVLVGRNVVIGPWSKIGAYSRIDGNVVFGQWASVGMECHIRSGSELGSHEYVPSGHQRNKDGSLIRIKTDPQDAHIFRLYDRYMTAIPAGAYLNEEYDRLEREKDDLARQVANLLPEYMERKGIEQHGQQVGFLKRLLGQPLLKLT